MKSLFAASVTLILLLASCSKDYLIQLPPNESKLVVECYLEDGRPMCALISESKALLDTSTIPPLIISAFVVITHGTEIDTLLPFAYLDVEQRRAYNFGNPKIVRVNYLDATNYRIDVVDKKGRRVSAVTHFIRPVQIESLTPTFNNNNEAFCYTKFKDDPAAVNYYRLVLNKNSVNDSISLEALISDNLANDNNEIIYGSGYDFKNGDSIHARLFHLTNDYYNYLNTRQTAIAALINPFAVSGEIVSNIKGGLGVFAALSYTQKSVAVRK